MGRKKLDVNRESAEPTESIRVPKRITRKLRVIAANQGVSMPYFLASILDPVVDEQFKQLVSDLIDRGGRK